jgi:hypothetical protein
MKWEGRGAFVIRRWHGAQLACPIEDDSFHDPDRARDQNGRGGDHSHKKPFRRLPGHEYARNYPDPVTGDPLQIHPSKSPKDFDSEEDFWKHKDALNRWNNGLPPPRPKPAGNDIAPQATPAHLPKPASRFKDTKSRHLAVRLTEADYELLAELARAHAVRPGTMARMLVVRGARGAVDGGDSSNPGE